MIDPVAVPKECSCGLTQDGGCYKDNHSCVYECPSGYQFASSDPCSYGYSDRMEATCSTCGDTWSNRCYKCKTGGGSKCPEKICNIVGGTVYEDGTCSNEKCRNYYVYGCCEETCTSQNNGEYIETSYGDFCTWNISWECLCGGEL